MTISRSTVFLRRVGQSFARRPIQIQATSVLSTNSSPAASSTSPLFNNSTGTTQTRSYHEAVIDHFNKPRNVGKLDPKKKNVGTALVGKASCGDVIKLQIEVDEETGNITDAKFKTFGCGSAIASSSLATEKLIGQPLSAAEGIKNTEISKELNLPPVKIHCSVLAEEAIQEAVADYKRKQAEKA